MFSRRWKWKTNRNGVVPKILLMAPRGHLSCCNQRSLIVNFMVEVGVQLQGCRGMKEG